MGKQILRRYLIDYICRIELYYSGNGGKLVHIFLQRRAMCIEPDGFIKELAAWKHNMKKSLTLCFLKWCNGLDKLSAIRLRIWPFALAPPPCLWLRSRATPGRREGHILASSACWLWRWHSKAKVSQSETNLNVPIDGRYQGWFYFSMNPPLCWLQQQDRHSSHCHKEKTSARDY